MKRKPISALICALLIDGSTRKLTSLDSVSQPVPASFAVLETSVQNDAQTPLFSQLPVTIWGENNVDATESNIGKPMCFFGLTVKMEKGNRVVNLYTEGEVVAAPTCEKTTKLNTHATSLTAKCAPVETSLMHQHLCPINRETYRVPKRWPALPCWTVLTKSHRQRCQK